MKGFDALSGPFPSTCKTANSSLSSVQSLTLHIALVMRVKMTAVCGIIVVTSVK